MRGEMASIAVVGQGKGEAKYRVHSSQETLGVAHGTAIFISFPTSLIVTCKGLDCCQGWPSYLQYHICIPDHYRTFNIMVAKSWTSE